MLKFEHLIPYMTVCYYFLMFENKRISYSKGTNLFERNILQDLVIIIGTYIQMKTRNQ